MRKLLRSLTITALAGVVLTYAAGYLGAWWWFFDLFSNFRFQYTAAFALIFLALVAQRLWKYAVICGVCGVLCVGSFVRYYVPAAVTCADDKITLLSFNVHTSNREKEAAVRLIRETNADVVALYEVDRAWMRALGALAKEYPHSHYEPQAGNFGIALLSRVERTSAQTRYIGPSGVPSIVAAISKGSFTSTMIFTHPLPPISAAAHQQRNAQITEIAEIVAGSGRSDVVVAGDLNATPWSAAMTPLFNAKLRDARVGFGTSPTWSRDMPILAIPIDHVLIGPALTASSVKILDATGSDHNPVWAELCKKM